MKKIVLYALGASLAASVSPGAALAAPITFDGYAPLNGCTGVTTGGLAFTSGTANCTGVWDPNPTSYNGTPALIYGFGTLNIGPSGGTSFSIGSFLAGISWYSTQTSSTINYTLNLLGGGTSTGSFQIGQGFQTITLNSPNITSATFSGLSDGYVAIDNFDANVGSVPEPATWAMMLVGFGAIGGTLRRRQKLATRIRFA